jgi:hypothetical protein
MPNPNAILSTRIRFDPPLEGRDLGEALAAEGGQSVDLGGDRRVRLDPQDRRSIGFATVLRELAGTGLPAYVELDPASGSIDRLLIPQLGRVQSVRAHAGPLGGIEVQLDQSHARHILPAGADDFETLERDLRAALEAKRPILVVEDFEGRIIDVREFTPDPDGPLPPLPEPGGEPIPFPWRPKRWWEWLIVWPLRKLWWWICYPWWWWHCPSGKQAQAIFDAMAATSCDPLTVPIPCIPFKYPDNGCWARASEMCRLMVAMGRDPAKVWIDGDLEVISPNKPGCHVYWGWHVAPTLCVRGAWPWIVHRMVIDPSLFQTPVTETQWKGIQNDPNATLTDTDRTVYWRNVHPTDPTYYWTKIDLATYRLKLYNRSIQVGPPPYPCP